MHPDMETIRTALYSGQISAAKIDAQRAFERVSARLNHYQRIAEPQGYSPRERSAEAASPRSAEVVTTWDDIKEIFHLLWGEASAGRYNKPRWVALQNRLWRLEAATESLGPDARENLITALRRIELPR